MGYGGKEALLTHTGKRGDAGLDGIIRQDARRQHLVTHDALVIVRDGALVEALRIGRAGDRLAYRGGCQVEDP
jgi:hypothetical protein